MRGKAGLSHGCLVLVGITPAYAGKRVAVRSDLGTIRDHPRVCGEKIEMPYELLLKEGSPPHVRGKAWGRCCPDRLRWDHPCVCGEKDKTSVELAPGAGSPPRVRGKVFGQVLAALVLGITPAYAGKSRPEACGVAFLRDHPRVCGEKRRPSSHSHTLPGSPPRVRGKVPSSI